MTRSIVILFTNVNSCLYLLFIFNFVGISTFDVVEYNFHKWGHSRSNDNAEQEFLQKCYYTFLSPVILFCIIVCIMSCNSSSLAPRKIYSRNKVSRSWLWKNIKYPSYFPQKARFNFNLKYLAYADTFSLLHWTYIYSYNTCFII